MTATTEARVQGLRLELTGGAIVLLPTRDEPEGPEIAMLFGFEDKGWMCRRRGEETFEHLT
ncbi:hypothetical protein [Kineococcus sp. R86509]|uniref:hypothetical protein n=1 Tax=Kineococcus sp. R86509 TaxID=3093851 RepID=UPI0036D29FA3